jgi:2-polyprenyl-3-methyl-5-hydroxy-6-metoxy-1,4-benzoquinol methylase
MSRGWDQSAAAWITHLGRDGDYGRRFVLDAPMLARVRAGVFKRALDVGCGEGRFCRMLAAEGLATTGIDPTAALIEQARALDPAGDYRVAAAETMELPAAGFDLVVCYLSLIDIAGLDAALANIVAALAPGGTLLIANSTSFNTAAMPEGWRRPLLGEPYFPIDHYLDEREIPAVWNGISITNHHRPLKRYLQALLGAGLVLRHFDEPEPVGGPADKGIRYRRAPYFHIMEWQKPG